MATHDPGKIVMDLAVVAVANGRDCLADINQVRADPAVFGRVASDPTVSRLITALAADTPDRATSDQCCSCRSPSKCLASSRQGGPRS